ncbi:MAG: hypothetical protein PVF29_13875 [Desulfobacterales bacterium]|jgi:hypothetical protein
MNQDLKALSNVSINGEVLKYLGDSSAHSDIRVALEGAVEPLGDVQTYCPNISEFSYIVVSTNNIIFGFAQGMNMIAFRLDATFKSRAIETGGKGLSEVGPDWVFFNPYRDDWPAVDLVFWARKAYVIARETNIGNK